MCYTNYNFSTIFLISKVSLNQKTFFRLLFLYKSLAFNFTGSWERKLVVLFVFIMDKDYLLTGQPLARCPLTVYGSLWAFYFLYNEKVEKAAWLFPTEYIQTN